MTSRGLAALEGEQHDGENGEQDDELGPCEHGQGDAEQGQAVVPPRRVVARDLQCVHGPEERRVGGDLGQEERGEDEPRHAEGGDGDEPGGRGASAHAAHEQVGRDARRADHERVQEVCRVERVGHEPGAEHGRDQERVELVDAGDERAVDAG